MQQQTKKLFHSDNHPAVLVAGKWVGHAPERMAIRKGGNFVDVFFGQEGFRQDEWARYQLLKFKGQVVLKYLKGATMPQALFNQLLEKVGGI